MKFTPGEMRVKFPGDTYSHKPAGAGMVPAAAAMYSRIFAGPLAWLCHKAAKGKCDDYAWVWASDWLTDILEDYCPLEACGLD